MVDLVHVATLGDGNGTVSGLELFSLSGTLILQGYGATGVIQGS